MADSRFFRCSESGMGIQIFEHQQPIAFPVHSHSEIAIVICTDGSVESLQLGQREILYPGQTLFTNAGVPHASRYCADGRPTSGVTIEFDSLVLHKLGYGGNSAYLSSSFWGKIDLPEAVKLARSIQDESRNLRHDSQFFVAALARQILVLALRAWPRTLVRAHDFKPAAHLPRHELVRAIEVMQSTPACDFAVSDLARQLHRSTSTFSRLFTRSVGQSPYNVYLATVLQRGADMLQTSSTPVKEIAFDLGFNSVSHFSNAFRTKWNMTPTTFRHNATRGILVKPTYELSLVPDATDLIHV
jgi:AraC-like DNA-binding protein